MAAGGLPSLVHAGEHGIVEAITGTGKTIVGAYAATNALDYGYKVAVTVPTLDLMDQWVAQLESCIDELVVRRQGDGFQDSLDDVDVLVSTIASERRDRLPPVGSVTSEHTKTRIPPFSDE